MTVCVTGELTGESLILFFCQAWPFSRQANNLMSVRTNATSLTLTSLRVSAIEIHPPNLHLHLYLKKTYLELLILFNPLLYFIPRSLPQNFRGERRIKLWLA